jgi:hypothetical protein
VERRARRRRLEPGGARRHAAAAHAVRRHGSRGDGADGALVYYALGDGEQGRKNVHDYYSFSGDFAGLMASAVCDTPQKAREAVASFEGISADDLIVNTGTDDIDDIKRLADIVL